MLIARFPLRRRLNVVMTSWHKLLNDIRDPYHPELHYMRGPGPRWRAKHSDRIVGGML